MQRVELKEGVVSACVFFHCWERSIRTLLFFATFLCFPLLVFVSLLQHLPSLFPFAFVLQMNHLATEHSKRNYSCSYFVCFRHLSCRRLAPPHFRGFAHHSLNHLEEEAAAAVAAAAKAAAADSGDFQRPLPLHHKQRFAFDVRRQCSTVASKPLPALCMHHHCPPLILQKCNFDVTPLALMRNKARQFSCTHTTNKYLSNIHSSHDCFRRVKPCVHDRVLSKMEEMALLVLMVGSKRRINVYLEGEWEAGSIFEGDWVMTEQQTI